jgi:hypothetical protein
MGSGLCEYAAGEGVEHMGRIFCLGGGGQPYEEIVFGLRGLRFGEDFEINVEEGCKISVHGSMDYGYQLAIFASLRT